MAVEANSKCVVHAESIGSETAAPAPNSATLFTGSRTSPPAETHVAQEAHSRPFLDPIRATPFAIHPHRD